MNETRTPQDAQNGRDRGRRRRARRALVAAYIRDLSGRQNGPRTVNRPRTEQPQVS